MRREDKIYFLKQRLYAIFMTAICIIAPMIDGEMGVTLLGIPLGIALFFTKDKVIMINGYEYEED